MRIILFSIVLFQIYQIGNAQQASRFDFFLGYGFYEGFNIGSEYHFKADKQSLSVSVGFDKLMKQQNIAIALSYNYAIFRSSRNLSDEFKWHLDNKAVVWQLNDEYYLWRALSLIPSINRKFILTRGISTSFDFGPSFNIVLYNKRKTYKEVGWPYHVMPDFRILFIF